MFNGNKTFETDGVALNGEMPKDLELQKLNFEYERLNNERLNIISNLNSPTSEKEALEVKNALEEIEDKQNRIRERISQLEMKEAA